MNNDQELVTPLQLAAIIVSSLMGVAILALPRYVVIGAGLGAPFASIVGVMVGFLGLLALVLLGRRFPKYTIIGYSEIILGKGVGRFFCCWLILYFTVMFGLQIRQFAEIVAGALLPNTPIYFAIFFMIFLCATTGFQKIATFAYIHFFYIPLIILPIILVLLPSIKDFEIYHLTPVLGHDPSLKEFLRGGLVLTQATLGFFVISLVIPFMKEPQKCVKSGIWGFLTGSLIVVLIITMTLAVFGEEEIQQMFWPTLILGRMVHIPAQILARVDSVLLISWIYGVFTTLLSFYFFAVRGIGEMVRTERYQKISTIIFPIVYFIAIFPQDVYQVYDFVLKVTLIGLALLIGYPLLLLLVAVVRKKEGASL